MNEVLSLISSDTQICLMSNSATWECTLPTSLTTPTPGSKQNCDIVMSITYYIHITYAYCKALPLELTLVRLQSNIEALYPNVQFLQAPQSCAARNYNSKNEKKEVKGIAFNALKTQKLKEPALRSSCSTCTMFLWM